MGNGVNGAVVVQWWCSGAVVGMMGARLAVPLSIFFMRPADGP
jgi:hypothetical protein